METAEKQEQGAPTESEGPSLEWMQWLHTLAAMEPGDPKIVDIGQHRMTLKPPTFGMCMKALKLVQRGLTEAELLNPESTPLSLICAAMQNWGVLGAIGELGTGASAAMDLLIGQEPGWCDKNLSPYQFAKLVIDYSEVLPMGALTDFFGPLLSKAAQSHGDAMAAALRGLTASLEEKPADSAVTPSDGSAPSTPTSSESTVST